MSTPARIEGWQNKVIPFIKKKLQLDPKHTFANSAEATDAAVNAFEEARAAAQKYRQQHLGEDDEMLHAAMAHFFEQIGVLPLDAVRMIDELFPLIQKPAG